MNYIAYEQGSKQVYDRQVGRIDMGVLREHTEGLVVASACLAGIPAWALKTEKFDEAEAHVKEMHNLFGENYFLEVQGVDYYNWLDAEAHTPEVDKEWIEMQAHDQKLVNDRMIELASKMNIPIVATTDMHYVQPEDRKSHLLMLAVQSKTSIDTPAIGRGGRLAFEDTPLLSTEELVDMMSEKESGYNGYDRSQVEEWIANTNKASDLCEPADYLNPKDEQGNVKYKIPLYPVEDESDYQRFLKWKDSLEEEQIDSILNENSNYLKTRLSDH